MYSADDFNGLRGLGFIARHGVQVEVKDENVFFVYGFYKSCYVEVNLETKQIRARYNQVTDIANDWTDLVDRLIMLNHEWQEKSAWRSESWEKRDPCWVAVEEDYNNLTKTA